MPANRRTRQSISHPRAPSAAIVCGGGRSRGRPAESWRLLAAEVEVRDSRASTIVELDDVETVTWGRVKIMAGQAWPASNPPLGDIQDHGRRARWGRHL